MIIRAQNGDYLENNCVKDQRANNKTIVQVHSSQGAPFMARKLSKKYGTCFDQNSRYDDGSIINQLAVYTSRY